MDSRSSKDATDSATLLLLESALGDSIIPRKSGGGPRAMFQANPVVSVSSFQLA